MTLLHFKQFNEGDSSKAPLILLHGLLGHLNDWQYLANALPKNIGCYGIDLPGHGGSEDVYLPTDNGFLHCSQLISATLSHLNISQCILYGYSLGGRIALYHASQHPEQLIGLIIESSHFGLHNNLEIKQRLMSDNNWANRFSNDPLSEVLTAWYQQNVFATLSTQQRELLIDLKKDLNTAAIANMLKATSLGKQELLIDSLIKHTIPSYYLCGSKDKKYQLIAQQFKKTYTALNTLIINDSGHNTHFEQPKINAEIIQKICQQLLLP